MSIYDNGFSTTKSQRRARSGNPTKVDVSKVLNDKDLTELIKKVIPKFKSSAKELLYDTDGDIIGFLTRKDTPYFFTDKEQKEFLKHIK